MRVALFISLVHNFYLHANTISEGSNENENPSANDNAAQPSDSNKKTDAEKQAINSQIKSILQEAKKGFSDVNFDNLDITDQRKQSLEEKVQLELEIISKIEDAIINDSDIDLSNLDIDDSRLQKIQNKIDNRQQRLDQRNKTLSRNPWQGKDLTEFTRFTRFIPDFLSTLIASTTEYDHVDIDKIQNYGCWCRRLSAKDSVNIGGRSMDEFDELCKTWYRNRHCLELPGGTCKPVKQLLNYYVKLNGTGLSNSYVDHCMPTEENIDDPDSLGCNLMACRIDYLHAFNLMKKYDEMDIGNNPVQCERSDQKIKQEDFTRKCAMLDAPPFVVCEKEGDSGIWEFDFDWTGHNLIEVSDEDLMMYKMNHFVQAYKTKKPDFQWTDSYSDWVNLYNQ